MRSVIGLRRKEPCKCNTGKILIILSWDQRGYVSFSCTVSIQEGWTPADPSASWWQTRCGSQPGVPCDPSLHPALRVSDGRSGGCYKGQEQQTEGSTCQDNRARVWQESMHEANPQAGMGTRLQLASIQGNPLQPVLAASCCLPDILT